MAGESDNKQHSRPPFRTFCARVCQNIEKSRDDCIGFAKK